jgi:hypothetical protein
MSLTAPYAILWTSRLLLGFALLFGGEILFWGDPASHTLLDWVLLAAGYVLIAVVLLDVLLRYRVRDLWGAMIVVGIYGVLNGLLLNPERVMADVPRRILSHSLGGYWFIGMETLGLFLLLLNGLGAYKKRILFIAVPSVGFFWGVWVYWFPAFNLGAYRPLQLPELYAYLAVGLVPLLLLSLLLRWQITRANAKLPDPTQLKLTLRQGLPVLFGLMLLFLLRALESAVDGSGLLISSLLLALFWVALWFRADTRKPPLLVGFWPLRPLSWLWLLPALVIFTGMATYGFVAPLVDVLGFNQFTMLTTVFGLMGAVWIPLTAAVLGVRTFTRQMQAQQY